MSNEPKDQNIDLLSEAVERMTVSFQSGVGHVASIRTSSAGLISSIDQMLSLDGDQGHDEEPTDAFLANAHEAVAAAETIVANLRAARLRTVITKTTMGLDQLRRQSIELRTTSTLARVACSGDTSASTFLLAFVEGLESRANDLSALRTSAAEAVASTATKCDAASATTADLVKTLPTMCERVSSNTSRLAALKAAHDAYVTATREQGQCSAEEVRMAVKRLVSCLQFPDTFAQRAEHVIAILEGAIDQSDRERAAARKLAAAHLEDLLLTLDHVLDETVSALEMICSAVSGYVQDDWSNGASWAWIEALRRTNEEMTVVIEAARSSIDVALGIVHDAEASVKAVDASLGASRKLNENLKIIVHNATIAAGRSALAKPAFVVLAAHVSNVVGNVSGRIDELVSDMGAFQRLPEALNNAALRDRVDDLAAACNAAAERAQYADDAARQLAGHRQDIVRQTEAVLKEAHLARDAFRNADGDRAAIESLIEFLQSSIAECGDISDVTLEWVEALYTMDCERKIHEKLLPSAIVAAAPAIDDELDGFCL